MAQIEQYRSQAAEWERLAAEAKSPAGQECYRSLAEHWWELASALERLIESAGPKKNPSEAIQQFRVNKNI